MSQWFHRRAAHGAGRCRCAGAAGLMGTQGDHQTEASSDLEVGVMEDARGANWACLDPCRCTWCCFRYVLIGAASPTHPSADVGFASFAVVSRGNSADNTLNS